MRIPLIVRSKPSLDNAFPKIRLTAGSWKFLHDIASSEVQVNVHGEGASAATVSLSSGKKEEILVLSSPSFIQVSFLSLGTESSITIHAEK